MKDLPYGQEEEITQLFLGNNGKIKLPDIKMDNGLDLNAKLSQRPSWKELHSSGHIN